MWEELIHNEYLHSKYVSQVTAKPFDSPFWKGLMRTKEDFFGRGSFKIGNGMNTRFWEDIWLGDTFLAQQYPVLYNIIQGKQVLVANILSNTTLNITFHRSLMGNRCDKLLQLVNWLMHISLPNTQDVFVWGLTPSGIFTVKSMYLDLLNDQPNYMHKFIWKMKVPLKIKIFMWFLHRKVILTKDKLVKPNWHGNQKCCFCEQDESIQHLFFDCQFARIVWRLIHMSFSLAPSKTVTNLFGNWLKGISKLVPKNIRVGVYVVLWTVWNMRNDLVFNKQKSISCLQVIPLITHSICRWSYLQPVDKRKAMNSGATFWGW